MQSPAGQFSQQSFAFLAGGGEMGALMRAHDWASSSVGPASEWPQALRTAVRLLLNTGHPMYIFWGAEGACFYNDAYRRSIGPERHPGSLGRPAREVWDEIWDIIGPQVEQVMAGRGATWHENALVPITRNGRREDVYWTYSYGPIDDETAPGGVGGVLVVCTETTDAVLSAQRLQAEQERHRRLLKQMPGFAAMLTGPEHVFEYVNDAYIELAGPRQYLGRTLRDVFPDLEGQGYYELLDQVFATGERYQAPSALVRMSGGRERFVDFLYEPIRDDRGVVTGVFASGYDVTERVGAEAELRDSERRYRTLFDAMDEGFCVIEFLDGPHGPLSDYVHVEANAAYTINAGIPDVVGQKVREMVPDEAEGWVELYREVLVTGQPIRFEKELEATGRWLELAAFRVEPASRKQVAVLFKDLTARKRAEQALRLLNATLEQRVADGLAERRLLAEIIQSADAFVQVVDLDLRWLAINDASVTEFERIFGVRPRIGSRLSDVLAHMPEHAAAVEAVWRRALAEAPFVEVQEFGDPGRDRRFYEMRFYPLLSEAGARIGAYQIVYDVSDRLKEQARLRDTEEALRQSQKMEAIGQLTGGLAHDFNNLLGGISGSLELLEKRLGEGRIDAAQRYIGSAQEASRRAAALTQRLLAFSRRQTLDPKPVDANKLIAGMEDLVRRTMGPTIEVEVVGAGGLWSTRVDHSQLENSILNLCINARDAMTPHGGRLTIETANKWLDERAARERELPPGQYVSICVTDTGVGMTSDVIARAFDPFFTTKPIGQGTGLGLSMVYGFVRQSNGQVRIYSEVGKGTTMCLYLPRHVGAAEEQDHPMTEEAVDHGAGEAVLVIDDEPLLRMLITEVLKENGYRSLEAIDGPGGLKILGSDERIDLLITDVGLPGGMNGRQVADAARKARPDLKVLFITGYAENAVVGNGHLEPGMAVLTKPFPIATLANRIRDLLDS